MQCELICKTFLRSFSLLNLEQNTSYSFLMTCSDRQDNFWSSEKINFDTGTVLTSFFHQSEYGVFFIALPIFSTKNKNNLEPARSFL